jgi:NitT/TauT family transport system permease protein
VTGAVSARLLALGCGALFCAWMAVAGAAQAGGMPGWGWLALLAAWALAWAWVATAARAPGDLLRIAIPLVFGATLLLLWEVGVRGGRVPGVLLPPPSAIWTRALASGATLWADFQQTFLRAVLIGWAIGSGAGLLTAVAIDRSPFLQRGLAPVGAFVSALPIIGVAPIMVMWFGFGWQSKAAVVVAMTFFPMLVNATQGLQAADRIARDLMRTYAASYWQTLLKLRLPAAAPFVFTALKLNATLALIGAIVAEFFGTPTVGMGFRISTEVGRMNLDMVWAEIAVAALAGSAFYGLLTAIERVATFWRPESRRG